MPSKEAFFERFGEFIAGATAGFQVVRLHGGDRLEIEGGGVQERVNRNPVGVIFRGEA